MTALPLVRVRLKHPDPDTFIERFAPNVTRGGIFLASREPRPVGSLIRFEVSLVTGAVALAGEGRVTWVKPFNPAEPSRPHGMGVQFTQIDPTTRPLLDRLLERRDGARPAAPATSPPPVRATVRPSEPITTEFDTVEDSTLRRMMDRARALSARTPDLEELLTPEPETTATLAEALSEFPRFFQRRGSGLHRIPAELATEPSGEKKVEAASAAPVAADPAAPLASIRGPGSDDPRPAFSWSPTIVRDEGDRDDESTRTDTAPANVPIDE